MKRKINQKRDNAIKSVTTTSIIEVPDSVLVEAPYADIGKDVYFYVSGSRDGHPDVDRHVAVFGGDVVISGSLKVEGCELTGSFQFDCDILELTGSIDVQGIGKFTDSIATTNITTLAGDPFLVAGSGISFSTANSGQITISATTGISNINWNEKLGGDADGINTVFTMVYTPASSTTLMVFVNGVLQEEGEISDFTLSGSNVVFSFPPQNGSKIVATYVRNN